MDDHVTEWRIGGFSSLYSSFSGFFFFSSFLSFSFSFYISRDLIAEKGDGRLIWF